MRRFLETVPASRNQLPPSTEGLLKRSPLFIIFVIAFLDLVGFGLIIPLQAEYAKRLGASGLIFGCLVGVYAAMQLIFNPILGRWSDRIGRRPVLMISVAGSVLSHALLGVADLWQSLPLLFVARILDGITGANIATAQAYIADVTPPGERARGMGLFGAAFGLGFIVGPSLAALLVVIGKAVSGAPYHTAWPAFGAAAASLAAVVLVWSRLKESRPGGTALPTRQERHPFRHLGDAIHVRRIGELLVVAFMVTFAFVFLEVSFVYLCKDRFDMGVAGIGLLFAYIGVVMVIVQGGLIGPLVRWVGEPTLISLGPFITAAAFLLIAELVSVSGYGMAMALLLVGCLLTGLGNGITTPSLHGLVSRHAREGKQGLTLGVLQGLASLARALAPPMGGILYDYAPQWPYWSGAAILVVTGAVALTIRPAQQASLTRIHRTTRAAHLDDQ